MRNDRRMEMQAKELGKGRKDLPLIETRAERMAAEEGVSEAVSEMNKPTASKRAVAVVMRNKSVAPKATKKVMQSIADKVAKARAAKGTQSEKYRK
jgi:hypothetical protein